MYESAVPPDTSIPDLHERLSTLVTTHSLISKILSRWDAINLPSAYLSGSIIAQARWNEVFGFDPLHGIEDADIVYFDPSDLSEEGEACVAARIAKLFDDLPVRVDVKNQARVHLWYPAKFGNAIEPYRSIADAITTFPTTSSAVAICRNREHDHEIVAPFGLVDLLKPVVRANRTQVTRAYFETKSKRWRECWPDLQILPWAEAVSRTSIILPYPS